MADPAPPRPAVIPSLIYRDNRVALRWLRDVFGLEIAEVLTDADGTIVHAEIRHRDALIMVGTEFAGWTKSPASIGGANTQRLHVQLEGSVDEHCERARRGGARIEMEPRDQFYGERSYIAVDCDGHHWTFSQTVATPTRAEMERVTGFRFASSL